MVLEAGLEYYQRMRPQYAKSGPEWIANMPKIDSPNEFRSRIELSSIALAWPYDGEPVRVGLSFGCSWDREHGFGVVLEHAKIIDVGMADCAIL